MEEAGVDVGHLENFSEVKDAFRAVVEELKRMKPREFVVEVWKRVAKSKD